MKAKNSIGPIFPWVSLTFSFSEEFGKYFMLVLQASSTPRFKISTIYYYVPANNENVEPDEREGEITTEDTVTISQRRNDVRERITQNTNRRDEQEKEALPAPSQVMSDIPGHLRSVRESSFPTWSCLVSQLSANCLVPVPV